MGLLCRWPSITEWEMFITVQGCRLRNDLYCVEWDVKLYYTIQTLLTHSLFKVTSLCQRFDCSELQAAHTNSCCRHRVDSSVPALKKVTLNICCYICYNDDIVPLLVSCENI